MGFERFSKLDGLSHPWVDTSRSPLIIVKYPALSTEPEINGFFDVMALWLRDVKTPWGLALDFTDYQAKTSTAGKRNAFAAGSKRLAGDLQHCLGIAAIAPSAIMRGIVTAVLWVFRPPIPHDVFANREAAMTWLQEQANERSSV